MTYGYNRNILHVNLTDQSWEVEEPSELWYRTYMGGSGFAGYYLLNKMKPGIEPLSSENVLVLASSVVTGVPISGFNRFTAAAKSPLTGAYGEAEAGGYFGPEMKFAGFDAIVIYGKAPQPTYLYIHNGEVELRDAAQIWGLDNWGTLLKLQEELGDKRIRVASIGQAGEKMVRFANISNDLEHFNGRTGMGAVMGSKNLKAVVARGTQKMTPADPQRVAEIARWHNARIKSHPPNVALSASGTPGLVKGVNAGGFFPTRNWRQGTFEGADRINWDSYKELVFHSAGTCWACSVKCKRRVFSDDPKYPLGPKWGGPEYETLAALGSMVGNDNIKALARGNQLCNLYGMDTISVGNVVAFVMECFEEGVLSETDLGGRSLTFGDADGMLWLIEEIANRRGIGDILADGVKIAAEKIGRGADRFAFTIKNGDIPFHDGRGKTGMALGFAVSSTGGDHVECPHDHVFQGEGYIKLAPLGLKEGVKPLEISAAKVRFFHLGQLAWGINNLLSICNFCSVPIHAMTFHKLVEAVQAITGWDASLYEIMKASERSLVMSRMFNIREGFEAKDDRVISRWYQEMPAGPLAGHKIDKQEFRKAIDLYYEMSGWDKNGVPTPGKLIDLELDWLISESQ